MVIPRSFSSGALSIESKARNSACPLSERAFVIAAVSVVLPWSMCPIVPTFTCGLVRANFFLAISLALLFVLRLRSPARTRRLGRLPAKAHLAGRTRDQLLTKNVLYQLSSVGGLSHLTE